MSQEPSSPRVTLRDIARTLGVSHVSVSRALHDSPQVSAPLRKKVKEAARRMGYRPNPMATALGQQRQAGKKQDVGAELAWINFWRDPGELRRYREFELYWQGAYRFAEQSGYRVEEFACGNRRISLRQLEKILRARNIRGILIPPHRHDDLPSGWEEFPWEDFSVVRFGYSVKFPRADIVGGNHVATGMIAFENMQRLGYRRIGLVTAASVSTRDKAGFLTRQFELPAESRVPTLVFPSEDPEACRPALLRWLEENRPDAVLTAIAHLRAMLAHLGYEVPRDIGLAVFSVLDGNADAGIDQNSEKIGEAAAETLISLLHRQISGASPVLRETLIEGCWIDGSSLPPR